MLTIDPAFRHSAAQGTLAHLRLVLPVFAVTLFLSAALLFSVQPMFTKMVLPLLGGSPSVWSVAMVFFQSVLLLGYAYAHALTRWFDPRRAATLHLVVLAAAFTTLPLGIASGFGKPPSEGAALWLIALFAASIGLPFFAVAASAPMLQAWFARTGHKQASDPYFLYGASNLGSFVALLAYPVLVEPMLSLRDQTKVWSVGFGLLIVLIGATAALLTVAMRSRASPAASSLVPVERSPAWRDRRAWTALAFVPSALLVAVTSHISTDVAAAPFLWVAPLALFLATFVMAFRPGAEKVQHWMVKLQPILAVPLAISYLIAGRLNVGSWVVAVLLNLCMFFISAMVCHRRLYMLRPAAGHLTDFYLWISIGGVLGGMFSGLLAPLIFPDVWEYPLLIVLAMLCRPGVWGGAAGSLAKEGALFAVAILVAAAPGVVFGVQVTAEARPVWVGVLVILAAAIMLGAMRPVRLVGLAALTLIAAAVYPPGTAKTETMRSFFGVNKVVDSVDGRFRILYHGTTIHGAERLRDEAGAVVTGRPDPLTYYYFGGPYSEAIKAVRAAKGALGQVAVVGLGTGTLACHALPGEQWLYYEIDPAVARIARDASKFRFLSTCAPNIGVVLGDARLTLADAPAGHDLIILDAFSSDAVPVHLLTREAVGLYLAKLADGGAIVFHISNRHLDLASVVVEVAAAHGLVTYVKGDNSVRKEDFEQTMRAASLLAVVARREEDLAVLRASDGWRRRNADGSVRAWTDDYSNILSAIWRRM